MQILFSVPYNSTTFYISSPSLTILMGFTSAGAATLVLGLLCKEPENMHLSPKIDIKPAETFLASNSSLFMGPQSASRFKFPHELVQIKKEKGQQ